MAIHEKSHNDRSVTFNGLHQIPFDVIGTVSASTPVTTVQALLPLGADTKVLHVSATTSAISGSPAIQIVYGTGAAGTTGTIDTPAVVGTTVFTAPISITAAAGVTQTINPPVFDTVYQGSNSYIPVVGHPLTLRVVTGTGDTASNLKVVLAVESVDSYPALTMTPSPDGTYGFNPSTF